MKKDLGKKLLKILLIMVIICGALSILRAFNIEALNNVLSIGYMPLGTLNVILFIYVMDRGEKTFSKIGLITIAVDILLYILELVGIYSTACIGIDCEYFDQFLYAFDNLCLDLLTLCNYMAILSLLKDNNDKMSLLKKITLYGGGLYAGLMFILYVTTLYYRVPAIVSVVSMIAVVRNTTFAAALILYLLNKTSISEVSISDNTVIDKKIEEAAKNQQKTEEDKEEKVTEPQEKVVAEETKEVESQASEKTEPIVESKIEPEPVAKTQEQVPIQEESNATVASPETVPIESVLASETVSNPTGIQSGSNTSPDTTPNSVEIQSTSVSDSVK